MYASPINREMDALVFFCADLALPPGIAQYCFYLLKRGDHNGSSYSSPFGFKLFALAQSLTDRLLLLFKSGERPLECFLNILFHGRSFYQSLVARFPGGSQLVFALTPRSGAASLPVVTPFDRTGCLVALSTKAKKFFWGEKFQNHFEYRMDTY